MSQTRNTLQGIFANDYTVAIGAGKTVPKNVAGTFFICTEVTGGDGTPFEISLDGNSFFKIDLGLGFNLPAGASFSKILLRNPGAEAITVTFYASNFQIVDSRLNIVRTRTPTLDVSVKNADTYQKSAGVGLLLPLSEVDLTGLDGDNKRKSLIISNYTPPIGDAATDYATPLLVGTVAQPFGVPIYPGGSIAIESGGPIRITNPWAAPGYYRVLETFYSA